MLGKCGNIEKKKEKKQIKSKRKMNIDGNKTEKDKTETSEYEIIEENEELKIKLVKNQEMQ